MNEEPRRITYPDGQDQYFIVIPAVWLGEHLEIKDHAIREGVKQGIGGELLNFVVAAALLIDWKLPHLPSNRELWEPHKTPAEVILWLSRTVLNDLAATQTVQKKS
jgi:hypothetical protein